MVVGKLGLLFFAGPRTIVQQLDLESTKVDVDGRQNVRAVLLQLRDLLLLSGLSAARGVQLLLLREQIVHIVALPVGSAGIGHQHPAQHLGVPLTRACQIRAGDTHMLNGISPNERTQRRTAGAHRVQRIGRLRCGAGIVAEIEARFTLAQTQLSAGVAAENVHRALLLQRRHTQQALELTLGCECTLLETLEVGFVHLHAPSQHSAALLQHQSTQQDHNAELVHDLWAWNCTVNP
mmetsp:Transcript_28373/g.71246  ORF Transcript_28373/g.71246 Transcript_28373/m.71246 type:complete len:236 (-) Transcript_28373:89-796(-)